MLYFRFELVWVHTIYEEKTTTEEYQSNNLLDQSLQTVVTVKKNFKKSLLLELYN